MARSITAAWTALLTMAVLPAALAGCAAEPASIASNSPSVTPSPSATPTDHGPSPSSSAGSVALPADCAGIYSDEMRARLEAQIPPLNDPGVTMYSSQNATLLEILDSTPHLRCTWGPVGDTGLATTLALLSAEQADAVLGALSAEGFDCADAGGATTCEIEQRGVTLEDVPYTRGERHALRGQLWVATAWLNVDPDGYTADILDTVFG